jgi:hypothetical protein
LVTFLATAIFGLILAVRRDYALLFNFPINLLFWHVEAGIVMTVVSVFHLSWHFHYYRDLLKSSREKQPIAARQSEGVRDAGEKERTPSAPSPTGDSC